MTGLGIELGMRIQELRNGRNMKQAEFAKLLGVTKSAVSSYENGTMKTAPACPLTRSLSKWPASSR